MVVAAVALIRNEADILPVWLAALGRWADMAVLMDHGSTDGSRDLLVAACDGRPGWSVMDIGDRAYRQDQFTAQGAEVAFSAGADWVLPLDADEFMRSPAGFCADLPPWVAPGFAWRNAVPSGADSALLAPRRGRVVKLAMSRAMWDAGHRWVFGNQRIRNRPACVVGELMHVPFRSVEQMRRKHEQMNEGLAQAGRALRRPSLFSLTAQAVAYPGLPAADMFPAQLTDWETVALS